MDNTANTGNPIAEDGFGPGDTVRSNNVTVGDLNIGDTIKVPGLTYNVRTVSAFDNIDGHGRCLRLDDGMILAGRCFNKVTHFLGNGLA